MPAYLEQNVWVLILLALWILPWKGVALWKAARNEDKWWFIVLFLLNDFAILEIAYIFYFGKKMPQDSAVAQV